MPTGARHPRPRLYSDGALADGRSDRPRIGISILATDGRVAWIRPSDDEGPLPVDTEALWRVWQASWA
jgi:hypothetical protein